MQVDYSERKKAKRWNDTKIRAAEMRQRAASATLSTVAATAPAAKPGPWLDLTPGARFTAAVRCSAVCVGCASHSAAESAVPEACFVHYMSILGSCAAEAVRHRQATSVPEHLLCSSLLHHTIPQLLALCVPICPLTSTWVL